MSEQHKDGKMALTGIRIVDFGAGGIDPITTSTLADFGAEVIKVESYTKLDFMRTGEFFAGEARDPDHNFGFSRYNQNKFGALINLKHPKGVALAKKLVSVSDVVIQNFRVDVIRRLGLAYEQLQEVKPDIIYLNSSFGGQTGPYRGFGGQGFIMAALAGLDDVTGWPDRGPVSPGTAFADHYLPFLWATVILAALEFRRRTGKGQFVDASSFEACLDVLDTAILDYNVNQHVQTRRGNHHQAAAPHGVYRCQGEERWCAIAVFTDAEWQSFSRVIGNPDWTKQARFATLLGRVEHADELDRLVESWTSGQIVEDVVLKLQAAGVAAGVVKNVKDSYVDPQLAHREHYWKPEQPGWESFTFEAPSARLSKTPPRFMRPAPLLGEHNDYVFFDLLKMSPEEYTQLVDEKVIY